LADAGAEYVGNFAPAVLVAIDDTDNLESRGTGFRARQLREVLEQEGCGYVSDVTRHQLFVSPLIPYTSHNSAACIRLHLSRRATISLVHEICGEFLRRESAMGSDAGLCIAPFAAVSRKVREFGRAAKQSVLTQEQARALARDEGLVLEGYTGTQGGVIGALAGVGLRAQGTDGRFLWLRGIRELLPRRYTLKELKALTDIQCFRVADAGIGEIAEDDCIDIWWSLRPVMIDSKSTLLLEKQHEQESCEWRSAPKELVKQY
jgi:hypothetical protein